MQSRFQVKTDHIVKDTESCKQDFAPLVVVVRKEIFAREKKDKKRFGRKGEE